MMIAFLYLLIMQKYYLKQAQNNSKSDKTLKLLKYITKNITKNQKDQYIYLYPFLV
jgi:hypothetical protein